MSYHQKATNEQIIAAYDTTGSVWAAAKILGMCGQSVHERLEKIGKINRMNVFTAQDMDLLKEQYPIYLRKEALAELATKMGRTKQFICRHAKKLGLTGQPRNKTPENVEKIKIQMKKWHSENPHPRGMLGKTHTEEVKQKMSEILAKRWRDMAPPQRDEFNWKITMNLRKNNNYKNREKASWKASWRKIGDTEKYYRSAWEANFARYLEWLKKNGEIKDWLHEPETFWFKEIKRGCLSYLVDFRVTENDDTLTYYEVKGWMDDRSKTKLSRMKKYYPEIDLRLIDGKIYNRMAKTLKGLIPDWE